MERLSIFIIFNNRLKFSFTLFFIIFFCRIIIILSSLWSSCVLIIRRFTFFIIYGSFIHFLEVYIIFLLLSVSHSSTFHSFFIFLHQFCYVGNEHRQSASILTETLTQAKATTFIITPGINLFLDTYSSRMRRPSTYTFHEFLHRIFLPLFNLHNLFLIFLFFLVNFL